MPTVTPLDAYRFCREEIKHEYGVLGTRLTSYITSQSFLFAAFAVSISSSANARWEPVARFTFTVILCSVGLFATIRAQPGIQSTVELLDSLHKRQLALHHDPDAQVLDPYSDAWYEKAHSGSLRFSLGAAYIFGSAWLALLCLTVWVYLNSKG